MTRWETTVALAREVAEECDGGTTDPARVQRLARSVLDVQEAMLGKARRAAGRPTPREPPRAGDQENE